MVIKVLVNQTHLVLNCQIVPKSTNFPTESSFSDDDDLNAFLQKIPHKQAFHMVIVPMFEQFSPTSLLQMDMLM